jgi:PAS domain S-box-containing protein
MDLFNLPPEVTRLADEEEAVVVVNVEGQVVLFNKAAEELFGVSAEDIVGEMHELLVPSDRRWGHQAYRRGYFADASERQMDPGLDPHLERPDGTLVPIAVWLTPIKVGTDMYVAARCRERAPREGL